MAERDDHKSLVYNAEHELTFIASNDQTGSIDFYGQTLELPAPRKFGDLDAVQTFVNKVHGFEPITRVWTPPGPPPKVAPRSGDKFAHYNRRYNVIAVPPHRGSQHSWAMNEIVVLHEMSHFFNRENDEASHGLGFIKCYLDLLGKVLHPTWELLMLRALDQRGVPLS